MKSAPFEIDFSQHIPEIVSLPLEQVARGTLSGEYDDPRLPVVLRYLVQSGFRFAKEEELLSLKRVVPGWPYNGLFDLLLAHHLVNFGYSFSMAELQRLGNPTNPAGRTVAHYMADMGRVFSLAELRALRNPPTRDNGWTLAQYVARAGHRFTVEDINELFQPNQAKQKWDVAAAMVDQGYLFSPQEMAALGEAACTAGYMGQTLQQYMDWHSSIVAGWAVPSFRLLWAGGAPYFDLKNTHYSIDDKGSGLHIGFGFYAGGDVFAPEKHLCVSAGRKQAGVGGAGSHRACL